MSQFDRRDPNANATDALGELERGRACYQRRAGPMPTKRSRAPIKAAPLEGPDLELLASSAYPIGRDDDYLEALDRVHQAYLNAAEGARAVRCAFWLGLRFLFRGGRGR
jgi:hypothetical protein